MAEYIEREELLKDINETVVFTVRNGVKLPTSEMRGANKVIDRIKSAPTADVVEVRHGEWMEWFPPPQFIMTGEEMLYRCSCCDAKYADIEGYKHCPYCGAKMDGKEVANSG